MTSQGPPLTCSASWEIGVVTWKQNSSRSSLQSCQLWCNRLESKWAMVKMSRASLMTQIMCTLFGHEAGWCLWNEKKLQAWRFSFYVSLIRSRDSNQIFFSACCKNVYTRERKIYMTSTFINDLCINAHSIWVSVAAKGVMPTPPAIPTTTGYRIISSLGELKGPSTYSLRWSHKIFHINHKRCYDLFTYT